MQRAGASLLPALERGRAERGELDCYAGEYRHAVVALAEASQAAAAKAGASTRKRAVRTRRRGGGARGAVGRLRPRGGCRRAADRQDDARSETQACVHAWTAGESLLEHLAVLYAIEAGQPEISKTKLEGLTEHYGYSEEGPAVEYFSAARAARRRARTAGGRADRGAAGGRDDARGADRQNACACASSAAWQLASCSAA